MQAKMTDEERQAVLSRLQSSREKLFDAVKGVSAAQAAFKPSADRWSILELTEHLASSDPGLLALIRRAIASPEQPELMEQARTFDQRMNRPLRPARPGVNRAPENLHPKALYATVDEAARAFDASRSVTIEYAQTCDDDLRSHFVPHPVFGPMDGYQWLMACAVHVESHVMQIEALKADPNYPQG